MKALILLDLQYDFCPGGALPVAGGHETIDVANKLSPMFPLVVATQDWHPPNHGSFAMSHPGANLYDVIDLHGLPQVLWPPHCVQGSRGAELHDDLDRSRITRVFHKGTDPTIDSYSGFWDNEKRRSTGMAGWLRAQGVTDLYMLGLATDYTVKNTAIDAVSEGFTTTLIVDGCRAVELTPGDGDRAIEEIRAAGVIVMRSDQLDL